MATDPKKQRIGIMAPGRALPGAVQDQVLELAKSCGALDQVELIFHDQCALVHGHFAGPDDARAGAFLDFANDPDIDAIWFARGGYGSNRLLDLIIPNLPDGFEKVCLGYSDAGYLLGALHGIGLGRPVHGPMPADILRPGGEVAVRRALSWLAEPVFEDGPPRAVFNLTTLAHLAATVWMPDLLFHELWVEDVSEYHYQIDRSLFAVLTGEKTQGLAGLRLGRFSDIPENDIDFGHTEVAIAQQWCTRVDIPYLGRCDIGHDAANTVVTFRR